MWRFRGTPYYLDREAARLGITQVLADRARSNAEIYRIGVLISQLSEFYHRTRREAGIPVFNFREVAQARGTLEQCELELQKLHLLAATAASELDESWRAFGFAAPSRPYAVTCENDTQTLPLGDGTVGIPDEPESAYSESG